MLYRIFPFLWAPELSPASSNSSPWLNTSSSLNDCKSKSKSRYDRQSVGQSLLVWRPHLRPKNRFWLLSESCVFGEARGRVCHSQLLLSLTSVVILGSESCVTHDHILVPQIRDSPNLEGQVAVFISLRNRVVQLYPQAMGSFFVNSYDSQGYGGGIRSRLHTGIEIWLQMLTETSYNTSERPRTERPFHCFCFLSLPWKHACLRSR
jgi:hypothetical protein